MFIGHYAVGFVLKKKSPEIPLWMLFVAVQFVDILAFKLEYPSTQLAKINYSSYFYVSDGQTTSGRTTSG